MTTGISIDPDEITRNLARDPHFGAADTPEEVYAIARRLPSIIGDERLGQPVTLEGLLRTMLDVLPAIKPDILAMVEKITGDPDAAQGVGEVYDMLSEQLAEVVQDVPGLLKSQGLTEEEALLSGVTPFNDEVIALYHAGRLTYGELVRLQPAAYLPKS